MASGGARDAEQGLHELRPARANQSVKSKDFALAKGEADIVKFRRMGVVLNFQDNIALIYSPRRENLAYIAPDHHFHKVGLCNIRNGTVADQLSIPKNGKVVRDPENLVELVADEKDRFALRFKAFDKLIELFDFLMGQRCGRLIHNDDTRINRQSARDCDKVLVGDAQIFELVIRIDIRTNACQNAARLFGHRFEINQTEFAARCVAKENILRNGQFIKEHCFLMDCSHAIVGGGLGYRENRWLPIYEDRATVGLINTRQNLHDGRFSSAVFSDQCCDFARREPQ